MELARGDHAQVVARATTDERDRGARNHVGATDDLLLIAGQAVGEQEQHAVRAALDLAPSPSATRRRRRAGRLDTLLATRVATSNPGPPRTVTTTPASPGTAARDLAGGRAADQRRLPGLRADAGKQPSPS